jgi:glutathione S-transferase
MAALRLFADRGCPFAHRVLALMDHLGLQCETSMSPIGEHPEGLSSFSPSGRIPLLVHDDLVIGESRVILEHLSEAHGFADAYPDDLRRRTLHRQAMALVDAFIAPRVFREDGPGSEARVSECLDLIAEVATGPAVPSLFAFHVAPMWIRLQWWRPDSLVTHAIRKRSALATWLDAAATLAPVARTAVNV